MTQIEALSAKTLSFSGIAGIGLSATAAAAALTAAVKSAADYGDQLDNLRQRTGETVENLSKLQYAAKMSDTTNEALAKGLTYLSGQIVSAANGAKESSAVFEKYGISVRNVDGTVRSVSEVLLDFADVFANLPDGPQKTALAIDLFGKKLGAELIPLLNTGKDGLKALGDEAESLGLVLNNQQAKAAADFNDNLDRLASLAKSAAVAVGNALIPTINEFLGQMEDARRAKMSIWEMLGLGLDVPGKSPIDQLKEAEAQLEKLKAKRNELTKSMAPEDALGVKTVFDSDIEATEKRVAYFKAQSKRILGDDEDTAAKRQQIGLSLARELANLEQLRAIAAGKASADILKDDKARTADQIKEAEKLRDALRSAWETSRNEAKAAADEATKLLEKAAGVKTSALDKATQMREAGLTPEQQQAANLGRAQDAQSQGAYYAAAAAAAKLDGRAADFEKYRKQAESFLERAQKFAESSGDANLVEQIGGQQAALIEQQAKAKQAEAAALEERAKSQVATLNDLETKLAELQAKAAAIEIKVKIDDALGTIANLQKQLDALKDKTITVTVNQVGSPEAIAAGKAGAAAEATNPTGFAGGGWTGPGGKFEPAGLVHRREFVVNSERTAEPGALDFLWRFHHLGMAALKGYAGGGLVDGLSIPSVSISSGSAAEPALYGNFYLDGQRHRVQASRETFDSLAEQLAREAMKKGRRG